MDDPPACGPCKAHPIDVLHGEHLVILKTLDGIEHEVVDLRRGARLRLDYWLRALDFLEHFADRCHHDKEEELLFAELERAGMAHDHGPLASLRQEHEQGRAARAQMAAALRNRDTRGLAHVATAFVQHLRDHIAKEDKVLFPLACELLPDAAVERLRQDFLSHEEQLGAGVHDRYLQQADRLAGCGIPHG